MGFINVWSPISRGRERARARVGLLICVLVTGWFSTQMRGSGEPVGMILSPGCLIVFLHLGGGGVNL